MTRSPMKMSLPTSRTRNSSELASARASWSTPRALPVAAKAGAVSPAANNSIASKTRSSRMVFPPNRPPGIRRDQMPSGSLNAG